MLYTYEDAWSKPQDRAKTVNDRVRTRSMISSDTKDRRVVFYVPFLSWMRINNTLTLTH